MQRFILRNKNYIMLVSAVLIAAGFISGLVFHNETVMLWALGTASVLGLVPIAIQAFQALRVRVISIDLLVTIAVTAAFLIQNFEESAVVTFLFLFGAFLEMRTLNKTRSAIKELTEMTPLTAFKQTDTGVFEEVDIDEVQIGDILLVKTGEKVPVDGRVLSGEGYINEASITGESFGAEKEKGSKVYAGTILENGTLHIAAERVGEDTTFAKIIELVEEAQDSKSEAERFIDRFAKYYTPAVLLFALLVLIFSRNLELAITILVLGCPGALVIGVPVSNVAGIGNGARHGILFKGSEVISKFSKVHAIVFDKTGTLTAGTPRVAEEIVYDEQTINTVKSYLAGIEKESSHPLAKAIVEFLGDISMYPVDKTDTVKGGGIIAHVNGEKVVAGNETLMEQEHISLSDVQRSDIERLKSSGHSLVLTAVNGELKVLLGIRDQIRKGVKEELRRLKKLGVKKIVVLSGDNQGTVDLAAKELELSEAHGHMLPENKAAYIKKLIAQGFITSFVGDGVNDSPSIALSDIGIAMGNGTDAAIETSDVVLMNSDFTKLSHALGLAKAISVNMKQNIFIAVGVVFVLLAGLFFSEWMSMSIGMLVHEASILVVIINGMRLLRFKLRN